LVVSTTLLPFTSLDNHGEFTNFWSSRDQSKLYNKHDNAQVALKKQAHTSVKNISATPKWPEPDSSVGFTCGLLGTARTLRCWEAIGTARQLSTLLFQAVKDLLDQHSNYLHKTEPLPFCIMFGLYMVGKTENNASPTLLISCEPKLPHQKALQLLRSTGILHGFPILLLAQSSRAPIINGLIRPLGSAGAADGSFIYFNPPRRSLAHANVCGLPIHVMNNYNPDDLSVSQKATLGGFVQICNSENKDLYCGLTVGRAFEDELEYAVVSEDMEFSFYEVEVDDELDSMSLLTVGASMFPCQCPSITNAL